MLQFSNFTGVEQKFRKLVFVRRPPLAGGARGHWYAGLVSKCCKLGPGEARAQDHLDSFEITRIRAPFSSLKWRWRRTPRMMMLRMRRMLRMRMMLMAAWLTWAAGCLLSAGRGSGGRRLARSNRVWGGVSKYLLFKGGSWPPLNDKLSKTKRQQKVHKFFYVWRVFIC